MTSRQLRSCVRIPEPYMISIRGRSNRGRISVGRQCAEAQVCLPPLPPYVDRPTALSSVNFLEESTACCLWLPFRSRTGTTSVIDFEIEPVVTDEEAATVLKGLAQG